MSKKKILVCGATGFIGRNIAERYAKDSQNEVIGVYNRREPFDNAKINFVKADLTNPDDVERVVKGVDVIVQAAATTSGSKDIVNTPHVHVTDNAVMNSLIFRAAHDFEIPHVVFFSCTVMYQSSDKGLKESDFNANDEIFPKYFGVGWTKVYIEKMAEFFSRQGRTKYTIFRHSNVYGPHDKYDLEKSHVFGATVTKVMTAKDKVNVWGDGSEGRDLIYVEDMVDAVETLTQKQTTPYELLNVGYGEAVQIKNLVQGIIDKSGKDLTIEFDTSKPTIKTSLFLDTQQINEKYGWKPAHTLEQGIEKTLQWYKENI